jgi:hypothetical protein
VKAQGGNPEPSVQARTRRWTRRKVPETRLRVNPEAHRVRGSGACTDTTESTNRFALRVVVPAARHFMRARGATVLASGATAATSASWQEGFGFGARHGVKKRDARRVGRTTATGSAGFDKRILVDEDARRRPVLWQPGERMNRS